MANENNSEARSGKKGGDSRNRAWTGREKGLLASTAVAVAAAIVGFALFAGSYVPADAAAKVDDFFISEGRVENYIDEYRARYGVEEDSAFARALLQQGMNVYTFRQSAINQLALGQLIDNRAADLGMTPSDADVDEEVSKAKEEQGAAGDAQKWQEYLDQMGVTEESLRAQVKTNLAEQAMYEAAVEKREPTDDDVRSYIGSNRDEGTERHTWRITFTGDDAKKRAETCLKAAREMGDKLDAEAFSELALECSDSPTLEEDKGDAGWTYSGDLSSYAQAVSALNVGDLSGVEETETEGNYGIAYCDDSYDWRPSNAADSLDLSELPESLRESMRKLTADDLWKTECNVYLANLLGDAQITYYPIPEGAPYNIDLKLSAMASGEALRDAG